MSLNSVDIDDCGYWSMMIVSCVVGVGSMITEETVNGKDPLHTRQKHISQEQHVYCGVWTITKKPSWVVKPSRQTIVGQAVRYLSYQLWTGGCRSSNKDDSSTQFIIGSLVDNRYIESVVFIDPFHDNQRSVSTLQHQPSSLSSEQHLIVDCTFLSVFLLSSIRTLNYVE